MNEHQRAAYLEILTWMARVRDQIRTAILEDRPPGAGLSDPSEQARLDALTQMYGSRAVRAIAAEWPTAFAQLMYTLAHWNALRDDTEVSRNSEAGTVRAQLEKDMSRLGGVMGRMQEQIRQEVQAADLPAGSGHSRTTSVLRAAGVLLIAIAGVIAAPPAWRAWWPRLSEAAAAHRTGVAIGLLIAGLFVVIVASGFSTRRGPGETEAG
jgi:hypothetical protein